MSLFNDFTLIYFNAEDKISSFDNLVIDAEKIIHVPYALTRENLLTLYNRCESDYVVICDSSLISAIELKKMINSIKEIPHNNKIGYIELNRALKSSKLDFLKKSPESDYLQTPAIFLTKDDLLNICPEKVGESSLMQQINYSLLKNNCFFIKVGEINGKEVPTINSFLRWFNTSFVVPYRMLTSSNVIQSFFSSQRAMERSMICKMFSFLFILFSFIYMPLTTVDYGISGDEFVDMKHSDLVLDYFRTGNPAALNQPKTALHLYGIGVQVIAQEINHLTGIEDPFIIRHGLNALIGALGILICGLFAYRLKGGVASLLAVLLLFFTPRYFGHSMNNLKDLPFAVGYIMSIYYFIRILDNFPKSHLRYTIGGAIGIFLAMGTRSGGLMLYPYAIIFAGFYYMERVGVSNAFKFYTNRHLIYQYIKCLLPVLIIGYILSILLWPYGLKHPTNGMINSLRQFTNYNIGLRTIFDGQQMISTMLPWRYAPQYLLIGTPLVVVVGCVGYIITALVLQMRVKKNNFKALPMVLLFTAIFPVFWVVYKHSNLYGGIRHLLFVMPIMVVMAAVAWASLIHYAKSKLKLLFIVLFLLGLSLPISHMIRNHPNDYIYFNELAGNLKHAYGNYETDYYFNSMRNASNWFIKNVLKDNIQPIRVATNHAEIMQHYFRHYPNVKIVYTRYYDKHSKDWDYAIYANVYINRFQLQHNLFPPIGSLYESRVDGFPMSVVLKRVDKNDLSGFQYFEQKEYTQALQSFTKYCKVDSLCEEVWNKKGMCNLELNQLDSALYCFNRALDLHPVLFESLYYSGKIYLQQKQYEKALAAANRILEENDRVLIGYTLKMAVYSAMKQDNLVGTTAQQVLQLDPNNVDALRMLGVLLVKYGKYKDASMVYGRLMGITKSIEDAVQLANVFCRLKDYNKSLGIINNVYKVKSDFIPAILVDARINMQQQKWEQMGKLLNSIPETTEDKDYFLLNAYYNLHNNAYSLAETQLKRVLVLDKDNDEANSLLQQLNNQLK